MRILDALHKTWFLLKWYAFYNIRLVMLVKKTTRAGDKLIPKAAAELLNERRQKAQKDIFSIIQGYGSVCGDCAGRCCFEEVDRYTSFDQHIYKAIGAPLDNYGDMILDPIWMLKNGLRHTLERKQHTPPSCRHLSPSGCGIEKADRPMLCASWFCPAYLRTIEPRDLRKLARPLKEIESIHREIAKAVK